MEVINWELVKHPMNWVIILLMVMLAGIFISLILDFYGVQPGTPPRK